MAARGAVALGAAMVAGALGGAGLQGCSDGQAAAVTGLAPMHAAQGQAKPAQNPSQTAVQAAPPAVAGLDEAAATGALPTEAKTATCILGPSRYKDACLFDPRGRGSFSLTRAEGAAFYDDVVEVQVFVFAPGQAEVRVAHADGSNTRMGEAARMEDYPACWLSAEGWSICAY